MVDASPFHLQHPSVGMKTVPVVDIDDNQDDDVQELAGGRPAAPGMDEPVAVSRPREPGDGIILISGKRVTKRHQPAHIGPVKPDVIECTDEEEEKASLGSPSYIAPDVVDDPEYGQPRDPLYGCYGPVLSPAPAIAPAVDHRDPSHPMDQAEKAQPDPHQESSASQEEVRENLQGGPNLSRGSTLVADLVDCTRKRETKLVLSLPPPGCPSSTNAQPDVLPGCPEGEEGCSVTNEPVFELQDPSSTRKHDPSATESELETAGREKEPQLEYSHFFIE